MMTTPTNYDSSAPFKQPQIKQSGLVKLLFAAAITGLSLFLLIHPTIGHGTGRTSLKSLHHAVAGTESARQNRTAAVLNSSLTVSISDAAPVVEGNPTPTPSPTPSPSVTPSPTPTPSPTVATFTISLSEANPDPSPVTVDYNTNNGTATSGSDYQFSSGTVSFDSGEQTKTITVPIIPDTAGEGDETFSVKLSNPQGNVPFTIADDEGQTTIVDDDPGGVIQFSSANFSANEGDGLATITVTRTVDLLGTVTVNFNSSNGTANQAQDYGHTAGTLTFGPGESSKTFQVPIINDTIAEPPETVNLQLSGATNGATLGSQQAATLFIFDNDANSDVFAV